MHLQADLGRDHRPLERVKLLSATGSVLLATAQLGRSQPPSGMLRAGCWRPADLRHTHASLLLSAGEPVKTVSERLGHASATGTMTVHAHVLPGDQKRAASRFAVLIEEA